MTEHDIRRWQHRRPSRQIQLGPRAKRTLLALALAAGAVFAWEQLATADDADPAASNCVGTAPSPGPDGQATWTMHCTAPMPSVTVQVPGPTVTVPGPTFTETTTITVTAPPSVSTTTVTVTPSPTTPPPTTTRPPTPTPSPSTPSPTPSTTPNSSFPNAANTGVPAGAVLSSWVGSCNITTPQTITGKIFACDVTINAAVNIVNSRVNGAVEIGTNGSLTMTDSEVNTSPGAPRQETGVETHDYTLLRVEIQGGNRGAYCAQRCTIQDSWVHGQRLAEQWHASAVRMEQNTTLIHNTLVCDAIPGPGEQSCSASLTGYGDYAPVQNNLIQNNYFPAKNVNGGYSLGFCAYGGSSNASGPNKKPYGDQANHIQFLGNVFERGQSGKCGYYAAVADWDGSRPGNVFTGNVWSDGKPFLSP